MDWLADRISTLVSCFLSDARMFNACADKFGFANPSYNP